MGELSRALGGVCGGQAGRRGASTSKSSSSNFGTSKTGYVPFLQIDGLEMQRTIPTIALHVSSPFFYRKGGGLMNGKAKN